MAAEPSQAASAPETPGLFLWWNSNPQTTQLSFGTSAMMILFGVNALLWLAFQVLTWSDSESSTGEDKGEFEVEDGVAVVVVAVFAAAVDDKHDDGGGDNDDDDTDIGDDRQ